MSTRTLTLSNVVHNLDNSAAVGVSISAYLLVPGGGPATNVEGDVIFSGQVYGEGTTTDNTGAYALTVVYPGDLTPTGCQIAVIEGTLVTLSPVGLSYASSITVSSWYPSGSTTGTLAMLLDVHTVANAADQGVVVRFGISATAIDPDGNAINANRTIPITTDSSGKVTLNLYPSSQLNPTTTTYVVVFPDGTIWYFLCPAVPTGNKGAYAGGTTYNPNAGTQVSPADVVSSGGISYQCIATTTGHAPPNATYWQVWPGEPITWDLTQLTVPGGVVIGASGVAHDANVPVLIDDPVQSPLTLDDDLHNLAVRTGHALRTVTGTTTLNAVTDDWLLADAGGAAFGVNLPSAAARVREYVIIRKNSGANGITLAPTGGQLINGASTQVLGSQYQWAIVRSDGVAAWYMQTGTGGGGGGAPTFSYAVLTANHTVTTADSGLDVDASGGNVTITLLSAAGISQVFAIKRRDDTASGHTVTIATSAGQTIDGQSTLALAAQNQEYIVASDGSNWRLYASYYPNPLTTEGDIPYWHNGALARLTLGATLSIVAGVLGVTFGTQAPNTFYGGPTVGASAAPAFRTLVPADLPIASTSQLGGVKADGSTITITAGGTLSAASSGSTLASLSDATISTPHDLDLLVYRSSDGKWHNVDPTAPGGGAIYWAPMTDVAGNLIVDANGSAIMMPAAV